MSSPLFAGQLWTSLRGWWREHSRESGVAPYDCLAGPRALGFPARLHSGTAAPSLRRHGVRLATPRQYHLKCRRLGWLIAGEEMMASLPIDFREFTFVDLGSGKGRTLLMASEYPFRRIVGVEILPRLSRVAAENILAYKSSTQRCTRIESVCADACKFELPNEPLLLYLFNPLPAEGLASVLVNLKKSLQHNPRPAYLLYHNPLLEEQLRNCSWLEPVQRSTQFSVFLHKPSSVHD